MFNFIKKLFKFGSNKPEQQTPQAPYKIEAQSTNDDYHDAPEWLRDGDLTTNGPSSAEVKKTTQNRKPRSRRPQGQKSNTQAQKPVVKSETTTPQKPKKPRGRRPNSNKQSNKPSNKTNT